MVQTETSPRGIADAPLRADSPSPDGRPLPLWQQFKPPPREIWAALPPGPTGAPVVGSAVEYLGHPLRTVWRGYECYGRAFTMRWFGFPLVWLIGPEGNRLVLSEQPRRLLWRPALASIVPLLGEGVL